MRHGRGDVSTTWSTAGAHPRCVILRWYAIPNIPLLFSRKSRNFHGDYRYIVNYILAR